MLKVRSKEKEKRKRKEDREKNWTPSRGREKKMAAKAPGEMRTQSPRSPAL